MQDSSFNLNPMFFSELRIKIIERSNVTGVDILEPFQAGEAGAVTLKQAVKIILHACIPGFNALNLCVVAEVNFDCHTFFLYSMADKFADRSSRVFFEAAISTFESGRPLSLASLSNN